MREATIRIPHRELEPFGVGAFVSACRDAGLRDLRELACHGDGCLFVARVDRELPEADLADLPGLEWFERLDGDGGDVVYLCKLSFAHAPDGDAALREPDLSSSDIQVDEAGVDVSVVGPQDALARSVEAYEDLGIDVALLRMADYGGPRTALDALTDRQREILETAHELGYFELPRGASAAEVAAALDLDPSTVTEHLRRAERNLLGELLSD